MSPRSSQPTALYPSCRSGLRSFNTRPMSCLTVGGAPVAYALSHVKYHKPDSRSIKKRSCEHIWHGLARRGEGEGSSAEIEGKTLMRSRLRIIVTGLIAQYPLGGVTWDYFQYVLGLAQLGHEVYYVEDTGQWPYNPAEGGLGKDCDFNVAYLAGIMSRYGLAEQWAYRFPWQSQWFGLSEAKRQEVIQSADLLINISGTLERPEEYRQASRLAYLASNP